MTDYTNTFEKYIQLAIKNLKANDYTKAEKYIKRAMLINPHSPVVHNLYGILEEYLNEYNLARKHFMVAYALDPTYKPSIRNFERLSTFHSGGKRNQIDFGDQPEEEAENPYVIVYDNNHAGHLCKKEME